MYCPSCGKKNDPDAMYCEFCGAEMIDTQPEEVTLSTFISNRIQLLQNGGAKDLLSMLKTNWKPVAAVLAVLMVLIFIPAAAARFSNPERVARAFFENYMESDWKKVYDQLYLSNSKYLDEEHFMKVAETWAPDGYLSYQVENTSEEDDIYLSYTFKYSTPYSTSPSRMSVIVTNTGKKALFFDDYKVILNDLIIKGCTIDIPVGAELLLDDEPVDTPHHQEGDIEVWYLPALFRGDYTVQFTHPVFKQGPIDISLEHSDQAYDMASRLYLKGGALESEEAGNVIEYTKALFDTALKGGTLTDTAIPYDPASDAESSFEVFLTDCSFRTERYGAFELTEVKINDVEHYDGNTFCCYLDFICRENGDSDTFSNRIRMYLTYEAGVWQLDEFSASII